MRSPLIATGLSLALLLTAAALVGVMPSGASAAADIPEPSPYPVSWELKFTHGVPKRIVVKTDKGGEQAFWYMTYRVTNKTEDEQQFLPVFELVTNEGEIVRSDKDIPARVFDRIKGDEGNDLLERRTKVVGPLHVGDDQARDSVAIWREPKTQMGEFSIYVAGLCGEFVNLDEKGKAVTSEDLARAKRDKHDIKLMMAKNEKTGENEPITLRKTLQLNYVIYGDEKYPEKDEIVEKGQKWIMR